MPIEHEDTGDSEIVAEPIRLHEEGHGVRGVIFKASKRQATDWQDSSRKLTWDDGKPIYEFVLNIAAQAGKSNFSVRNEDGKPMKGSDGRTLLEERTFNETDVCVIASGKGSYELYKKCQDAKVNEGFEVRIARGKKVGTKVDYEVEVLSTGNPLVRFDKDKPAPSGIDHGADDSQDALASAF